MAALVDKNNCEPGSDKNRLAALEDEINSLKKELNTLQDSEKKYLTMFHSSPAGIVITRMADGIVVDMNRSFTRMTGYDLNDVLGKTSLEVGFWVHETVRDKIKKKLETDGSYSNLEFEFKTRSGEKRVGIFSSKTMKSDNEKYFLTSMTDISDRVKAEKDLKEREQVLQAIFNSADDSIFIKEKDRRYSFVNPAMEKLMGLGAKDLVGKRAEDLFDETAVKAIKEVDDPTFLGETMRGTWTINVGSARKTFHVVEVPLRDALGQVEKICGIVRDLTDQENAEAEKRNMAKQLLQAQRMEAVGTLASGIAHDVNNILQIIFTNSFLLQEEIAEDHPGQDMISSIVRAGQKAADMIDKVLLFSRTGEIGGDPLSIGKVIEETTDLLWNNIPPGIEIRVNVFKNAGTILGDSGQIHRVLVNLANNAVAAMNNHGGTLTIEVKKIVLDEKIVTGARTLQPGPYARLRVSDTGHGMDEKILSRVFDPFFSTREMNKGTGLGLAVVHGIVLAHRGAVTVQSEPGRGATFDVYFPSVPDEDSRRSNEPDKRSEMTASVLLVDDDPEQVELGLLVLTRCGYQAFGVYSGQEALEILKRDPEKFDLLIADQNMPGITGIELLRAAKTIASDMKLIVMTGRADDSLLSKMREIGVTEILKKPFSPEKLNHIIANSLQ